jgi:SAM-dependent methyltransferase
MQDDIFANGEGDAWYARNAHALHAPGHADHDITLELLLANVQSPRSVLEVGCADGWRLEAIRQATGARCYGIDTSCDAIKAGRKLYPELLLRYGRANVLPFATGDFDVVLLPFVLHWVARESLAQVVAEVDRVLVDGGMLAITDFYPSKPSKVRYHHRSDVFCWTWKQDYSLCWQSLGIYDLEDTVPFNHDTGGQVDMLRDIPENQLARVIVLKKVLS